MTVEEFALEALKNEHEYSERHFVLIDMLMAAKSYKNDLRQIIGYLDARYERYAMFAKDDNSDFVKATFQLKIDAYEKVTEEMIKSCQMVTNKEMKYILLKLKDSLTNVNDTTEGCILRFTHQPVCADYVKSYHVMKFFEMMLEKIEEEK